MPLLPVTFNPLVPVLVRIMPLAGSVLLPVTLMLLKVSPLAPMVVFATLSAVPVVVVNAFTTAEPEAQSLVAQTFTVPPLVAVNAAFVVVDRLKPPLNTKVAEPPVMYMMSVYCMCVSTSPGFSR